MAKATSTKPGGSKAFKLRQYRRALLLKNARSIRSQKLQGKNGDHVIQAKKTSANGKGNVMSGVEDFFQDDTENPQRRQVEWAQSNLSIDAAFFWKFLKVERGHFANWLAKKEPLYPAEREHLANLWRTILHLLSFMDTDPAKVKQMLAHEVAAGQQSAIRLPAWTGTTLLKFLEREGPSATRVVDEYVTAFRFGDLYAATK